jgi:hypothetical protein
MIRQLQAGEALPLGEPKRYRSGSGYVRLRWQVSPMLLVEVYEHRLVTGTVGQPVEVHHKNGIRDDNRLENLEVLTPSEHRRKHATFPCQEASDLYSDGWSTLRLAEHFGIDPSAISRGLRRAGYLLRDSGCGKRIAVSKETRDIIRSRHNSGWRVPPIAREAGLTDIVVRRILRELGLKPHRAGRYRLDEAEKGYVTVTEAA